MPKKILQGLVVKDTKDKSAVVLINTQKKHKRCHKIIKTSRKYLAHDESNSLKSGEIVKIQEHIPFSKRKKWLVLK